MVAAAIIGAGALTAGATAFGGSEQASAANNATQTQLQMYQQTRADLLPYMNAGQGGLNQLMNLMGMGPGGTGSMINTLQQYPGYQWAFGQGLQALDQSAASRGLLLSGGQLAATQQYGQGMADQLFNQYYGQLGNIAQMGENAAAGVGQTGSQLAQGAAQTQLAAGSAIGNTVTGIANDLSNAGTNYLLLNSLQNANNVAYSPSQFAALGADALSDRRAKKNIRRIGKLDSGLPIYSYEFKGSSLPRIGVMADEVRKVAPHAVRRAPDGYDRVDYRKVSQLPRVMKEAA